MLVEMDAMWNIGARKGEGGVYSWLIVASASISSLGNKC